MLDKILYEAGKNEMLINYYSQFYKSEIRIIFFCSVGLS
jgi:hypothetical protein